MSTGIEDGDMKKLTPQEAKQQLLKMLIEFATYCDANNLRYYLIGGTLLGAVRHKGFIPWDDDIDVGMPRPDYERFIQLQRIDRTMEVLCVENENSGFPFMKIVDTKTLVKQPYSDIVEMTNLWIDVFPFDGWARDYETAKKDWEKRTVLFWGLVLAQSQKTYGKLTVKKIFKAPAVWVAKTFGRKWISEKINVLSQKYSYTASDWIGNFSWSTYEMQERVPKEWFEERVKLLFEGCEFWAPKEWDKYLTAIYGNYMQLPPVEKRENHNMEVWVKEKTET